MIARRGKGAFCRELLKTGLVVLATGPFGTDGDVVDHQLENDFGGTSPTSVNEHRAKERFERIGEDRLLVAASRLVLAPTKQHLWANADSTCDVGQRGCVDDRGTQFGQLPLGEVIVNVIDVLGDCQPENGVAKELEPLIRLGGIRLCAVAPMSQSQLQQCGVSELMPDRSGQFLGVGRLVQESAPTWLNT